MKLNSLLTTKTGINLSLGLDIGTSSIKALVTSEFSGRITVRDAVSIPVPEGIIQDDIVVNPKRLGKILSDNLPLSAVGQTVGAFSVPSNSATIKWLALPNVPVEERRSAARFRVRKHLSVPIENVYVDAIPSKTGTHEEGQTLVIAVPKAVIESRAEALECAGIQPISAELEPFAIMRMLSRQLTNSNALWQNASLTIIDIGGTSTQMYVVQNQDLQFIRSVPFGTNSIINDLAKKFNLSFEEADRALSSQDASVTRDGTLSIVFKGNHLITGQPEEFNLLTREFSRLLRYFRSLHPERSYAGILNYTILCGGLSGLNGLSEYLGKSLGLRIEVAQPFRGFLTDVQNTGFNEITSRGRAYTVAGGLALACTQALKLSSGGEDHQHNFEWHRVA